MCVHLHIVHNIISCAKLFWSFLLHFTVPIATTNRGNRERSLMLDAHIWINWVKCEESVCITLKEKKNLHDAMFRSWVSVLICLSARCLPRLLHNCWIFLNLVSSRPLLLKWWVFALGVLTASCFPWCTVWFTLQLYLSLKTYTAYLIWYVEVCRKVKSEIRSNFTFNPKWLPDLYLWGRCFLAQE